MHRRLFALLPLVVVMPVLFLTGAIAQGAEPILPKDELVSAAALTLDDTASSAASGPTGTGPPPRVGPNVRANAAQVLPGAGLLGRSETTIAGTDDGENLVAGFNDAQGFCGPPFGVACTPQSPPGLSGYAFSTDGGLTWTDGGGPSLLGTSILTRGDPWLDRDGAGTFFYANLSVNSVSGADLGVSVHRGHFAGSAFTWDNVTAFNAPNAPRDFYDKEAIAVAKDASRRAYVSLTNFKEICGVPVFGNGQIEVWRTANGGDTWQGPVIAGPEAADSVAACGASGHLQQSSAPAVGPSGEVYVVWQFGPTLNPDGSFSTDAAIDFARSLNGGLSFSTPATVAGINSLRQDPPVGYNRDRINDHPRIAVATTGPDKGRVYVTYYSAVAPTTNAATFPCPAPNVGLTCRGQRLTSSQVFLKFSDDQGATWSSAIPLAPTPPATGVKRFWPVVNVEPGGNVDVVYYESSETVTGGPDCNVSVAGAPAVVRRRRGPAHSLVNTFWVRSTDGGASFAAPINMSSATSDWCTAVSNVRPNFGDYIGAAVGGNRVLALWADGRNGVPDSFFAAGLGGGKAG